MKVTVAMSVYNGINMSHLKKAIFSIQNQTFRDLEFIIITDGILNYNIKSLIETIIKYDKRVKLIENKEKKGLAFCLNKTIEAAQGEYYARMDADDYCHEKRIEKEVLFLEENKDIDVVGTFCYEIDEDDYILSKKRLPVKYTDLKYFLLHRDPFVHPSTMFRKSVFSKIKYDDRSYNRMEDTEIWTNLFLNNFIGSNIPEYLFFFRIDNSFFSRRRGLEYATNEFRIRWNYFIKGKFHMIFCLLPVLSFCSRLFPPKILKLVYAFIRK